MKESLDINEIFTKEELTDLIKNKKITKKELIYIYKQMLIEDYKEYLVFLDDYYKENNTELKNWYEGIKAIGL